MLPPSLSALEADARPVAVLSRAHGLTAPVLEAASALEAADRQPALEAAP